MNTILVALDLEEDNSRVISTVITMAQSLKAHVWIMHVAAPEPDFVGYEPGPQYIRDSRASELRSELHEIQSIVDNLKKENIKSDGLLVQGATVDIIMEESKKLNTEMLVIGHKEHTAFHKIFFGGNTNGILKYSEIPVLVIPL